jgi:tRNA modification GTPase
MQRDTIAALATARGPASLAVVRISGPEAIGVADRLLEPSGRVERLPSHTCAVGYLAAGEERVDQVVVTLFRAPHSYTGEDIVEIACHGGDLIPRRILDLILSLGSVRAAREGEFTLRAYLNGKLDLAQAEAVETLITARSASAARAAMRVLHGDLRRALNESLARLTDLLATVEATLDVQEDGEPDVVAPDPSVTGRDAVALAFDAEHARLSRWLAAGDEGRLLGGRGRVVIAGRPNAGKSSLFNALLARDRAIVSCEPGTTRDVLEASVEWEGLPLTLVDTAGLSEGGRAVELEGARRAREAAAAAVLVIYVIDAAATHARDAVVDLAQLSVPAERVLLAIHKWDLVCRPEWEQIVAATADADGPGSGAVPGGAIETEDACHALGALAARVTSSVAGTPGVEPLRLAIAQFLRGRASAVDDILLVGDRQRRAVSLALEGIDRARRLWARRAGDEVVAFETRRALDELGGVLGMHVGPEVLERVFSRFCVGK